MNLTLIESIIVAAAPAVTAIITMIGIAIGILKKFRDLLKSINGKTDITELKDQLKVAYAENAELKKQINKLLNKMNNIKTIDGDK